MKIALINPFYPPYIGGIEKHVQVLAEELSKKHEVIVVTSKFPVDSKEIEKINKNLTIYRLPVLDVNMPFLSPPPALIGFNVRKAFELIKDCDIVHLHNRWFPSFLRLLRKCKRIGIKTFITFHEPVVFSVSEGFDNFARMYDDLWTKKFLKFTSGFFAVSEYVKKTLISEFKIKENKINVCYNGVNLKLYKKISKNNLFKRRYDINYDYVLFVGRLVEQKGLKTLMKTFEILKEKGINAIVIGKGSEKQKMVNYKLRKNLTNVRFIDEFVPENLLFHAYSGASCFIMPSLWEAFGMVCIEAMACGCPVVVSKTGGLKEIVNDGVNGFLVKVKDYKTFAKKTVEILDNEKLRNNFIKNGYKTVKDKFDWSYTFKVVDEAYKK